MTQSRPTDNELHQQITSIANSFKVFECKACAKAIQDLLTYQGISGKLIKLYTGREKGKYGNIYHEKLKRNIATNGCHQGVAVEFSGVELIFDNLHPQGITRKEWLNNFYCIAIDLGSGFEITEIEF
ncbi:MAG: papain fold toxin domain-containing protein [Cyanobacteria bacterium P01_F01_bin.143]